MDLAQKKQLTDMAERIKSTVVSMKKQEQDATNDLAQDAENALAKELRTLNSIQSRLDDVVKQLQPANPR